VSFIPFHPFPAYITPQPTISSSKKTYTTYALVHRPQNDPRINDSEASSHVFAQISGKTAPSTAPSTSSTTRKSNSKIKQRGDLEDEFGIAFNPNEGEAAEHGIYYDDTNYDYMQHMRDLGGSGVGSSADAQATWLEAPTRQGDRKRNEKKQQSLEDALRSASLSDDDQDDMQSTSGMSYATTSKSTIQRPKYEAYQDIPDAIAGFQPNMDPRLREVLEALEDEAYVEEEDDFFNDLAREGGDEIDQDEFEDQLYDDFEGDEDGWESDTTEKPTKENIDSIPAQTANHEPEVLTLPPSSSSHPSDTTTPIPDSTTDGDWLASFAKSKASTLAPSTLQRNITPSISLSQNTTASHQRKKKRKGALTNASGYSMTSSALARTEVLSVLDDRFERLADMYMNDIPEDDEDDDFDDTASAMTGMSRATAKTNATWKTGVSRASSAWGGSQAPSLVSARRVDTETMTSTTFDSMMDEFLDGVGGHGRGIRMKKSGGSKEATWGKQTPMQQLDEVRNGLGGARLSEKWLVGREGKVKVRKS